MARSRAGSLPSNGCSDKFHECDSGLGSGRPRITVTPQSYGPHDDFPPPDRTWPTGCANPQEGSTVERDQALEMALGQIEKQYGQGAIMRLGEKTHVGVAAIPTGALALDIALGIGGLPRGRVV